jgi:hypothetical protein
MKKIKIGSQNERDSIDTNIEQDIESTSNDILFYQKIYAIEKQISNLEKHAQENDHPLSSKEGKYYKEIQSGLDEYRRFREESNELGKRLSAMETKTRNQIIECEKEDKKIR